MSTFYSPRIVTDGLVLCLDAANPKSYRGDGTTWYDLGGNEYDVTATTISGSISTPGNVIDHNYSTIMTTTFPEIDKYDFTFSYTGRSTGTPISNYRSTFVFYDTNTTAYYRGDTRTTASPYILHYVKDYAISSWSSRLQISTTDYPKYEWNQFDLAVSGVTWTSYVNGINLGTNTVTQDLEPYTNLTRLDFNSSASNVFQMQYVKLYNRKLSSTEILQNYNATKGRFGL